MSATDVGEKERSDAKFRTEGADLGDGVHFGVLSMLSLSSAVRRGFRHMKSCDWILDCSRSTSSASALWLPCPEALSDSREAMVATPRKVERQNSVMVLCWRFCVWKMEFVYVATVSWDEPKRQPKGVITAFLRPPENLIINLRGELLRGPLTHYIKIQTNADKPTLQRTSLCHSTIRYQKLPHCLHFICLVEVGFTIRQESSVPTGDAFRSDVNPSENLL